MKVSIIIPVYNVSKYIERCLLSALNQTWQDLEIILVDDCTPDDSMEIAKRVAGAHVRGEIVTFLKHDKNRGQSAARNTGIDYAIGDYIYFLDSDDYLPHDSISTLAVIGKGGTYDFVSGSYEITGTQRAVPLSKMGHCSLTSNDEILSAYASNLWPRVVWNILIRKQFLKSEKLYFVEGIIHEDDFWTFQLACKAQAASFVENITYYYFTHYHSTTGNPSMWNLECRVRIIGLMYDYIMEEECLQKNRYVYTIFEEAKAKYFDRIIYFTKDTNFHHCSYMEFRHRRYISAWKAFWCFYPKISLLLCNLHYVFPSCIGYVYFKLFVKITYYWLVLPIKVKRILNIRTKK